MIAKLSYVVIFLVMSVLEVGAVELVQENAHIKNANIVDIEKSPNKITIMHDDVPTVIEITKSTEIISKELHKFCSFESLNRGMYVDVIYDVFYNEEANCYTNVAKDIIIIKGSVKYNALLNLVATGIVTKIDAQKWYMVINEVSIGGENHDEMIIYIDRHTKIRTSDDQIMTINDIKLGQKLSVITTGTVTSSAPPQTVGIEIILLPKKEQ